MKAIKGLIRAIIGLIFGLLSTLALVPAVAAIGGPNELGPSWVAWLATPLGLLLGFFAFSIRRAFGRGFLLFGIVVLSLPLSVMLLSGRGAVQAVSSAEGALDQSAAAIGSGLAGIFMTGASAVIGFFLGGILIIVGLVLALGGRREIITVRQ